MPARICRPTRFVGLGLFLLALSGCSAGSAAHTSPPGTPASTGPTQSSASPPAPARPSATRAATSAHPSETRAAGSENPTGTSTTSARSSTAVSAPPLPEGRASCAQLSKSQASSLLGVAVQAGVVDRRTSKAGQHEVDGCSYAGAGGARLGYLVWELDTVGTRTTVLRGLPPTGPGVQTFSPGVGTFSAGTVVTTGPVSAAQVNAVVKTRLVQVSATATTGPGARSVAIAAARALIS